MKNQSKKGKDPAFLFYSSDFLTGTMTMSNDQVGMYVRLMCLQHQKGKLTEKDMLNICKSYDEDVFQKFTKDEHGLYSNERLAFEIQRRIEYSQSRRKNRLGDNISTSYDPHMENENETINTTKKLINIPFQKFWDLYDKKVGDKVKLTKKWNTLSNKDREAIMSYIPKYKKTQPDKKFRKNPETFFNNQSWNDELVGTEDVKANNALSEYHSLQQRNLLKYGNKS
jgi:hypothetical protein